MGGEVTGLEEEGRKPVGATLKAGNGAGGWAWVEVVRKPVEARLKAGSGAEVKEIGALEEEGRKPVGATLKAGNGAEGTAIAEGFHNGVVLVHAD